MHNPGRPMLPTSPWGGPCRAVIARGTCSARIGLQADAAIPVRTMVREFPVSPHAASFYVQDVATGSPPVLPTASRE